MTARDSESYIAGYQAGLETGQAMVPSTGFTKGEALLFALIGVLFGIFVRGWL
jgi:hypothetical protein